MVAEGPLPAVLLEPAWEFAGPVPAEPAEPGCAPPGLAAAAAGGGGLTLCARVRRTAGELAGGRILQLGEPPSGWRFEAPSELGGAIAFAAGLRAAPPTGPEPPAGGEEPPPRGEDDVGGTRLDDGEWHHVAVALAGGRLRSFVDGRLDGEVELEVSAAPPDAELLLGAGGGEDGTSPSAGNLADVQAYSQCLTDEQIAGLASGCSALPTGVTLPLVPCWIANFWAQQPAGAAEGDAGGPPELRKMLEAAMGLGKDAKRSFQDEVVSGFFFDLLARARQMCLSPRKAAVFGGIMWKIFSTMHGRSETTVRVGEPMCSSECFLEYKRLLVAHTSVGDGPAVEGGMAIFSLPEVRQLTDFVSGSVFQHFVLYQSVLVCPHEANVKHVEVSLEQPRAPPDLRKGKLLPAAGG